MFSSNDNVINPFAHLPSSSCHQPTHPPSPLLTHDDHLRDLQSATTLLPVNPQLTESLTNMALLNNASITRQDGDGGLHGGCFRGSGFCFPVKKPVKIGRQRKICTAHGVRDRRVRLSIGIAREFFDLQEKLGFDEASKTLDWLLSKSKNAIRELVKMKYGNGSSSGQRSLSSSPECEVVADNGEFVVAAENGDLDAGELEGKGKSLDVVSKENTKRLDKPAVPFLAKESRAKARARARERTREKMCTRRTTTNKWNRCPDTSPQFLNQISSLTQLESSKKLDHSYGHNMASSFNKVVAQQVEEPSPRPLTSAAPGENVIEEAIVIKRKLKASTVLGYQQNLEASQDVSCSSSGNNC